MDLEKQPAPQATPPEGCLTVAIRIPVRIVVLVLVVPVRIVWDALVVVGRFLRDSVLRPLWRALVVWPCVALWRYVVVPLAKAVGWLAKVLVVIPLVWLYRYVLTPVGHGIAWLARGIVAGLVWVYARVLTPVGHGIVWLLKGVGAVLALIGRGIAWVARGIVAGLMWVYARLFTPVGHGIVWLLKGVVAVLAWIFTPIGRAIVWCARGIAWLAGAVVTGIGVALYWIARVLLVLPVVALWRWVLAPIGRVLAVIGREVWDALGHAWRIAGHISLAVGRFLGTLFRWIFVEPVRWVYRSVLTPVGHVVRDVVLRPVAEAARSVGRITRAALASARESVRQARADVRRMLFGDAGAVRDVGAVGETREREAVALREPKGADTRTLGSSTTALTKD
ncbi:hypothetical protein [Streptomyces sp. Root369]|uniref:hypothetical protein n=1 Tax=Streptomyces sp. Root369 TaxID=1736523 RepID=UPI00070C7969|nr:hypothetical protein [Streptomyces sp. Root369]KQV99144.1 hypothetical protein ASD08_12010 [Streptomyces sp. Root369]